ncbi:hypothetical protein RFI_14701 [Reticulomyxa filosa]|uniref:Uncharacterized protein n=1 Tax=Reticulomyxa filosa TaxID=46433 RepID=X6N9T1_RETFI|nr:hypothetical protein RFI_14701 [Reticulomyxa filosa]|eukprot:ETO22499.1 hypothetical protein RFI_14701 [Reticulomyxa filosa]
MYIFKKIFFFCVLKKKKKKKVNNLERQNTITVSQKLRTKLMRIHWCAGLVLFLGVMLGSLLIILWMYFRSQWEVGLAMDWTVETVAEHTSRRVEYEFAVPSELLSLSESALHTGDIHSDFAQDTTGKYDPILLQFKYLQTAEYPTNLYYVDKSNQIKSKQNKIPPLQYIYIYIYMYICDLDSSSGIFIAGGTRPYIDNPNYYKLLIYNGTCLYSLNVDNETDTREPDQHVDSCDTSFDPTTRPWYKLALTLNNSETRWTEPYKFVGLDQFGMSLVTRKMWVNQTQLILLVEYTLDGMQHQVIKSSALSGCCNVCSFLFCYSFQFGLVQQHSLRLLDATDHRLVTALNYFESRNSFANLSPDVEQFTIDNLRSAIMPFVITIPKTNGSKIYSQQQAVVG